MSDTRVMLYKEFGLERKDQADASQESLFKPEWLERMDRASWSPPLGQAIRMQCPKCFTLFWAHEALWGMRSDDLIVNCPACSMDLVVMKCVHDIREDEDDLKKPDDVRECPWCHEEHLWVFHDDCTKACVNCGYSVFWNE